MSTPYNDVYSKFLSNIKDSKLVDTDVYTADELESFLYDYMVKAGSIRFKECKVDLSDRDDVLKQFNNTLSDEEQTILSKCMIIEWLSPYVNNANNLKERLSTKDYQIFSPGNQLKAILELYNAAKDERKSLIRSYVYNGFTGYGVN